MNTSVRVETVLIPTYGIGKADKNPMFLEKRVYQGSSGKVYPLPVIDKILDEKEDRPYTAVWLENDYIRVMVLPGQICSARGSAPSAEIATPELVSVRP